MDLFTLLLALLAGLVLGGVTSTALTRARVGALHARAQSAELALAQARAADSDLELRQQSVVGLVSPLREQLSAVEGQLRALETERARQIGELSAQVSLVRDGSERLGRETAALVTALRRPHARGQWGEMQLRRVVEHAGMLERCDFSEQVSLRGEEGALRPDLVVHLPEDRCVVVDAKVSLAAYLEAVEAEDDQARAQRTTAHARHLREHVDRLADKAYWQHLETSPEFVVLFLPGEALLGPALEADPGLLDHAYRRGVHLATPTTLITLLRAVAHGWRGASLAEDTRAVLTAGRQVYERLGTVAGHLDKLGRSLSSTVTAYNATVGSVERTLLPSARRMNDLDLAQPPIDLSPAVEARPRLLAAPEFLTG